MSTATLDSKKVIITVAGFPITGFSKTFVKITRAEDSFKKSVGADGFVTRVKSNDLSGSIEITLMQGSPSNSLLSALNNADERMGTGIVPVTVTDLSGTSASYAGTAWVKKPADQEWGAEDKDRAWTLDCSELVIVEGGNFSVADMAADIAATVAGLGA